MRMRLVLVAAMALFGCGPDFEAGGLAFTSTLSRDGARWTPGQPVALGSRFGVSVEPAQCLFNCPPRTAPALVTSGAKVTTSVSGQGFGVATQESGFVTFSVTASSRSAVIHTSVLEPTSVEWADPLPGAAAEYNARNLVTGERYEPPVLADDIVMHAGGELLVQLWATHAGRLLASDSSAMAISGASLVDDRRVARVEAGSEVVLQLADGGAPKVHHVRAGDVSEVTSLELTAMNVMPTKFVVHAVARIEDGGVYYAPPIEWSADEQLRPYDYSGGGPKFPRRSDVTSWDLDCKVDGGAPVTASINGLTATVAIPCVAPEELEPTPMPEEKQGCATVPGELLGLALVAWLGRRRRSV